MEKSLKSKKKKENMLWVSNNGTQIFPILKRESWICQNTGQTQKWTLFYVNWRKHKWQQYWITSKLTILLCLLNELLGIIHPFNPFSLCISMLWQFFWTFLPLVGTCAHLGYPLPICVCDFMDWYSPNCQLLYFL